MRVDEKLRRIRQIFRFGSLKGNRNPAAIAAALSNESFEDYCTHKGIKDASKSDLFQLMELEQADEKVSSVANAARTGQDVRRSCVTGSRNCLRWDWMRLKKRSPIWIRTAAG